MKYILLCLNIFPFIFIIANTEEISSGHLFQNEGIGKFWQITDIHWDLDYSEAGDPTNMCHKSSDDSQNSTGHFGNYLCDAPYALVRSALHAMKNIEPNPNFILWTGDNAPHTRNVTFSTIFRTLSNITEEIKLLFDADMRILPVLGNHDTYPQNDYPPSLESFYNDYLEKGNWKSLIPEDAQKDFKTGGYYKVQINPDLDVLVLNTNLYYRNNKLGEGLKDPGSQFKWLRGILEKAKNLNRKIVVAAHAPPGYWERLPKIPFLNDSYNDEYVDILNEFGEQIVGQIYGHEHTDSFRIFGRSHDDLRSVGFVAPSLTPWQPIQISAGTAINPSIRLYMFSPISITDYVQYHMNLTEANKSKLVDSCSLETDNNQECSDISRRLWKEYYQATKVFGINSANVKGLTEAFYKMCKNDTYFQAYYLRNSAGIENGFCNETCKQFHLCAITHLKIKSLVDCLNSSHGSSSSVFNLSSTNYDTSDIQTLTIISIAMFCSISLAVFILAFVLYRRSGNISNRAFSEHAFVAGNRDGYRPLSTEGF